MMDLQKVLDLSLKDAQQIARRFSTVGDAGAALTAALKLIAALKSMGAKDEND
jgi:hypothetical protein